MPEGFARAAIVGGADVANVAVAAAFARHGGGIFIAVSPVDAMILGPIDVSHGIAPSSCCATSINSEHARLAESLGFFDVLRGLRMLAAMNDDVGRLSGARRRVAAQGGG